MASIIVCGAMAALRVLSLNECSMSMLTDPMSSIQLRPLSYLHSTAYKIDFALATIAEL